VNAIWRLIQAGYNRHYRANCRRKKKVALTFSGARLPITSGLSEVQIDLASSSLRIPASDREDRRLTPPTEDWRGREVDEPFLVKRIRKGGARPSQLAAAELRERPTTGLHRAAELLLHAWRFAWQVLRNISAWRVALPNKTKASHHPDPAVPPKGISVYRSSVRRRLAGAGFRLR